MPPPNAPRVVLDARHMHSGIGRYVESLALSLATLPAGRAFDVSLLGDARRLAPLAATAGCGVRSAASRLYTLREQFELPRRLRGIDLFHATHYPIPWAYRGPLVVSVLDLNHLAPPGTVRHAARWLYARIMLGRVMRRAERIVAITQAVAEEIAGRWPAARERLRVIHLTVGPRFAPVTDSAALAACRAALALPPHFILVLGNLYPYKNVETVVRALAGVRDRLPLDLVIAGQGATAEAPPVRLAAELGIGARVRAIGPVPETHLPALLSLATIGAAPSRREGFGLVPLEMMACGVPVVASAIAPHREVLADAAVLLDPDDHAAWGLALCAAVEEETARAGWIDRGRERAARFGREREAAALCEVYREAMGDADGVAAAPR